MASVVLQLQDILPELTCDICKGVFDKPRCMKSCPHTFCLRCIETVKPTSFLGAACRIKCPSCGVDSQIGIKDGLSSFQSNHVADGLIKKLNLHLKEPRCDESTAIKCCHEPETTCQHCTRNFCLPCVSKHVETIQMETSETIANLYLREKEISRRIDESTEKTKAQLQTAAGKTRCCWEAVLERHRKRALAKEEVNADMAKKRLRSIIKKMEGANLLQALKEKENKNTAMPLSARQRTLLKSATSYYLTFRKFDRKIESLNESVTVQGSKSIKNFEIGVAKSMNKWAGAFLRPLTVSKAPSNSVISIASDVADNFRVTETPILTEQPVEESKVAAEN